MPGFSYRKPLARKTCEASTDSDSSTGGHHGDDGKSKTFGRGIVADFKRTIGTWWVKEMTNFNTKTIAVSFFLFIAVIAPTITFGAVYAKATNNYIGAVELLLATAWCGIFYSLVSGQPMVSFHAFNVFDFADKTDVSTHFCHNSVAFSMMSLIMTFSFSITTDDQWWHWTCLDLPSSLL